MRVCAASETRQSPWHVGVFFDPRRRGTRLGHPRLDHVMMTSHLTSSHASRSSARLCASASVVVKHRKWLSTKIFPALLHAVLFATNRFFFPNGRFLPINLLQVLLNELRPAMPEPLGPPLQELLRRMWRTEPSERPDLAAVLEAVDAAAAAGPHACFSDAAVREHQLWASGSSRSSDSNAAAER